MHYTKPLLKGFAALASIQETGPLAKTMDLAEPIPFNPPSDPAYQADE